jgi:3-oxoacyl-[acyl-carrier protein] reductase
MRLKDQVALVTGGSRGIGRGIALAFAAEGCKVGIVYKGNQAAAEELVSTIKGQGGSALALQADVADPEAAVRCRDAVIKEWGRLDILVNNAGVIHDELFIRMDADGWNRVIQTNLGGVFNFCKAVAYDPMLKQRSGRIINMSSVAAEHVNQGQTNYAASKGAINAFTRALAVELASRNITVNAIAPGFIETDMSAPVLNKAGDQLVKKLIPMRRLGKPEDIARVAVFLASPDAAYITGQVITVDGGLSLGAVSG